MSATPSPQRRRRRSRGRLAAVAVPVALLTSGCGASDLYERSLSLGVPEPVSDRGENIYNLWLGSHAAAAVVGVFVLVLIFWAVFRYRKRTDELPRQVRYNLPVEVLYTVVPFVIIAVLFYYTTVSQNFVNDLDDENDPDVTIGVIGFQWNWTFNYVNESVSVTGTPFQPALLVLPTDRTIRFVETSPDVIHSFWVPEFLFKRDVIPGRTNQFELTLTKEGEYIGRCAEFCGEKHSRMNFGVRVVSPEAYDDYIEGLQADPATAGGTADGSSPTATGGATGAVETAGSSS